MSSLRKIVSATLPFFSGGNPKGKIDILAQGMNSLKGLHAEVSALRNLHRDKDTKKQVVDLLVVRVDDKQGFCVSKPCLQCMHVLKSSGQKIRYVYFSQKNALVQTRFENL